jgi:hypothetical protein
MVRSTRSPGDGVALPAKTAILEEKLFVPAPASARTEALAPRAAPAFRILRTREFDAYDKVLPDAEIPRIGVTVVGDDFRGTARKAAKLSVVNTEIENFDDLEDLLGTLPTKSKMTKHQPPIETDAQSERVEEEKRNARVRTFLYAASREDDNDFHLIVGREPAASPKHYMTMEISGLPPENSKHFTQLKHARDAYKAFFGADLPGPSYDFYDPPIPVIIAGSLFFDMSHAQGPGPGPSTLRPHIPTIWELHPITEIEFEPQDHA